MRHPPALNFETTVSPADKLDGLTQPSTVIAAMPSTVSTSAASTFSLDALANVTDPLILLPRLSRSNARKMMSAPTGSFTGLIDTAPSAYALSFVLCHPICCDGAPPVAVEPAPSPTERIGMFQR